MGPTLSKSIVNHIKLVCLKLKAQMIELCRMLIHRLLYKCVAFGLGTTSTLCVAKRVRIEADRLWARSPKTPGARGGTFRVVQEA